MFFRKSLLALLFIFMAAPALAKADETKGLYAPPPPADAVYLRDLTQPDSPSLYKILHSGALRLELKGGQTLEASLIAGQFYSLVKHQGQVKLLQDKAPNNPAKAVIALYNLTDYSGLSLRLLPAGQEVLPAVAPGAMAAREVNGTTASFEIRAQDKSIGQLTLTLERKQSYSIIAQNAGSQITLRTVVSEVEEMQ